MFIDDLHWADDQSWELILQFIRDLKLTRLILIGAYRKDELSCKRAAKIQSLSQENIGSVLDLKDWDVERVNSLLASLLQMRLSQTKSLASLIFAKSAGNPYFTIEVLKAVKKKNLLRYSIIKTCWEWDPLLIQSNIHIGDNLVDICLSKFFELPSHSQNALILSSCFGPKFDADVVEAISKQFFLDGPYAYCDKCKSFSALDDAVEEGIIEGNRGSSIYRFAHDKIYEAVYSQVSKFGMPDNVHSRIGSLLLILGNEQPEEKSILFLTAKQSHNFLHLIETSSEALRWAEINLNAAKAAIDVSAYHPAAEYLHHGLLFNQGLNLAQHDLQLELLVLQARVHLCLGDFPKCYSAVDEVIESARNIEEKIPVFQVCIDALIAEGKVNECLRLGQNVGSKTSPKV
jgi:predicted ATPase